MIMATYPWIYIRAACPAMIPSLKKNFPWLSWEQSFKWAEIPEAALTSSVLCRVTVCQFVTQKTQWEFWSDERQRYRDSCSDGTDYQ